MNLSDNLRRAAAATGLLLLGASAAFALPHIKWIKGVHQFGSFSEDLQTVTCEFKGINTGDETLVLYDVKPNCGCTTTKRYAGMEFEPGDTITIEATYNAVGRPGRFTKKLQVTSNADNPKTQLVLQGTVIGAPSTLGQRYPIDAGPVRLHSATSLLGTVTKGKTAGAYIKCYNQSTDTLTPTVVNRPKYMNAIIEPKVVNPGEQFVVSLNYYSGQNSRWGIQNDTIRVAFPARNADPASAPASDITTVITIEEDFSALTPEQREAAPVMTLTPAVVDLRRFSRADKSPVKQTVEIANTGKSPLIIRQISCVDPAVSFKLADRTVKPGKKTRLELTIDPKALEGKDLLNARVMFVVNDPANPSVALRIVGELTD